LRAATWRFFETFVTPADNMLPPDNFQEDPAPVVRAPDLPDQYRALLLSAVAAAGLRLGGNDRDCRAVGIHLQHHAKLPRFKGHFFNWYGTGDLRPLEPAYISSVDSGNLAGHLIALANACEDWVDAAAAPDARLGLADNLRLRARRWSPCPPQTVRMESNCSRSSSTLGPLNGQQTIATLLPTLKRLAEKGAKTAQNIRRAAGDEESADLLFWIEALRKAANEHGRDRLQIAGSRGHAQ